MYSASTMMDEKMDGTLSRSMFAGIRLELDYCDKYIDHKFNKISSVLGVKVLELLISMLCINTMLVIIQSIMIMLIVFVYFSFPIIINSGIFVVIILLLLIGWIGFFAGRY